MKLDDFFAYVLPEVVGCPDPMLRNAVRMTAIDFCNRSHAWTLISDPVPLLNTVMDYELDTPTDAYPQTVCDVWLGARRLTAITMAALQQVLPNWQTAQSSEPNYYNLAAERGVLRVFPTPIDVTDLALVIRTVFIPTLTARSLPDFLGQDQMEVIAAGTKSRLMQVPGTPWNNPTLGLYYKQIYDSGVVDARIEEAHDRVPGSLTVAYRSFGF